MSGAFTGPVGDPESVPIRPAATVVLLRDADDRGFEVCLMQRNLNSDFVGGAYVFPGGGVDPDDEDLRWADRVDGLDDPLASLRLGIPSGGLAFWVALVREAFEEADVLLAVDSAGEPVRRDAEENRWSVHRADVDRGRRTLWEVFDEEDVRIAARSVHYFARWITPLGAPRRYDTQFFVARVPGEQEVHHDDRELIGTHWMTPTEALSAHERGEFTMIFPTIRTLAALDRFDSADAVLAHAAGVTEIPAIVPLMEESPHGWRIRLPGDPEDTGGLYDAFSGRPVLE
ncbi:MAG: NUDIX domain-containing protein [Actinobacteria bacterium]|nr:NUDIX domain-containing protein [Actinomycetota bacterium]